jgi:hypothetical protein
MLDPDPYEMNADPQPCLFAPAAWPAMFGQPNDPASFFHLDDCAQSRVHKSHVRVRVGPRGEPTAANLALVRLGLVVGPCMVAQMGGIEKAFLTHGAFQALFNVHSCLMAFKKLFRVEGFVALLTPGLGRWGYHHHRRLQGGGMLLPQVQVQ